jgi:hypothetical protein
MRVHRYLTVIWRKTGGPLGLSKSRLLDRVWNDPTVEFFKNAIFYFYNGFS